MLGPCSRKLGMSGDYNKVAAALKRHLNVISRVFVVGINFIGFILDYLLE